MPRSRYPLCRECGEPTTDTSDDYCDFCKATLSAEYSYEDAETDMHGSDYQQAADDYETAAAFDGWGAGTIPRGWWADWAVAMLRSKQFAALLERLETHTGDDLANSWMLKAFALMGLGRVADAAAAIDEALRRQESEGLRLLQALLAEYSGQALSAPNPLVQVLGRNARIWEDGAERGNAAGDWVGCEIDRHLALLVRAICGDPLKEPVPGRTDAFELR